MSKKKKQSQEETVLWVGLDWGEFEHAVTIVNDRRELVLQFTVKATREGLDELGRRLEEVGTIAGVAIEATANLVVSFVIKKGFMVYPVNPKLSKNWREGNSVAGVKSDARDGHVLAVELARRYESLRVMEQGDPDAEKLASLCEALRDLVDQRTAHVQRLKALLRQYYPAALEFFKDVTCPVFWRFLNRFPNPETLAKARKNTLCGFLKKNCIGLSPKWIERVEQAAEATAWPCPEDSAALQVLMTSTVKQLQALQPQINQCDDMIAEQAKKLPEPDLVRSIPGAGKRMAPPVGAIVALVRKEEDPYTATRCLSGVAPIEHSSGKKKNTQIRRRCNKHWRNVMFLFARATTQYCKWAKAFYELCRERGDSDATALRKLGDKWLKIIHRMVANNEPYDDERYVEALRKSDSPVYAKLCGKVSG